MLTARQGESDLGQVRYRLIRQAVRKGPLDSTERFLTYTAPASVG